MSSPAVAETSEKKTRTNLNAIVNVDIAHARVNSHLKDNLGDDAVSAELKTLRAEAKAAPDGPTKAGIKARIAELSKSLLRISHGTPMVVAAHLDALIKELFRHGIAQTLADKHKIVEMPYLHSGNPETLIYYPLYERCPVWASFDPKIEEEEKKKQAANNKSIKEIRAAAKAAAIAAGKAKPEKRKHVASEEPGMPSFATYVDNALQAVKVDPLFVEAKIRVSQRTRACLTQLVAEVISSISDLSRIIVQRVVGVRTMNPDHVESVVTMLLVYGGRTPEQVASVVDTVHDKLGIFEEHIKIIKSKKAEALSDAQKANLEVKKLEADLARKTKQAELAKKRAMDSAAKTKELNAEVVTLAPRLVEAKAAAEALKPVVEAAPAEAPIAAQ